MIGDLSKWYVAKGHRYDEHISDGASTFTGDLSKWYVAKVTDMTRIFLMVLRPPLVTLAMAR